MTLQEQVAWLRQEVMVQTGCTVDELDGCMSQSAKAGRHVPLVNISAGKRIKMQVAAEKERDQAYAERAKLLAAIAWHCIHGDGPHGDERVWVARHEGEDWDDDWRTILFIQSDQAGQFSWHFHKDDAKLLGFIPRGENTWDGHTTEDKYERLLRWFCVPE